LGLGEVHSRGNETADEVGLKPLMAPVNGKNEENTIVMAVVQNANLL